MRKNTYIYKPPNERFIYEIVSGAVKLGSYSEHGEEFVHDILHKDFFGNLRYLNGQFFDFQNLNRLLSKKI
jgi:CRP-like cAMP-binding protein